MFAPPSHLSMSTYVCTYVVFSQFEDDAEADSNSPFHCDTINTALRVLLYTLSLS